MASRIITRITKQQHVKQVDIQIMCHIMAVLYDYVDRQEDCKGDVFFLPLSPRGRLFLRQHYDEEHVFRVTADSAEAVHQQVLHAGLSVQDSRGTIASGLTASLENDTFDEP